MAAPCGDAPAAPDLVEGDDLPPAVWPPQPESIRATRQYVRAALQAWGLANLTEAATLVVSELATNAVVHARSEFQVVLQQLPDGLLVRVNDRSPQVPVEQEVPAGATGGRGLLLLDRLCCGWGTIPDGRGGKAVWALIDTASATRGAEAAG